MSRDLEVLEAKVTEHTQVVPFAPNLPISKASLDTLSSNRKLVSEFITSQLREDVDFGIIPGTKFPSLYKPGAEKFCKLFNLTIETTCIDKEIDRHGNFAMFTYRATVFGPNGRQLAQVEGSCNSQEKKYKERNIYQDRQVVGREEIPVCDILNTLQKMAQKRAKVGGVIEAVGASDFYTQDIDDADDAAALGLRHAPKKAAVTIPKATSSRSEQTVQTCTCGNPMMISMYGPEPRPWYCGKCKATIARGGETNVTAPQ